ncbi:MAG: hypothetical protein DA407_04585 [Bacteroidetes bacterium]|nr:MAG: hypothetical protein DA407_04585 [Bacteroidota bacterium]
MISGLPYKTKQLFFMLIKLSIVIGGFYFIYNRLTTNEHLNFNVFIDFLKENGLFSMKIILFLMILTFFNWFFEILKWQNLVQIIEKISFFEAAKQSLAALTASLFTPNRIGDYAAKAVYFKSSKRRKVILLNLIGNMMQMTATTIFGITGFCLFIYAYNPEIDYYKLGRFIIILVLVLSLTLIGAKQSKFTIKGFSVKKVIDFISNIPKNVHLKNALYSIVKYLIFSFQFYILLQLFGVDVSYFNAMVVITTMYLAASIIPSVFIFDVVIKGSVALFVFEIVGVNDLTILSIIALMWILNFVIPSIIGSFFVIRFNAKNLMHSARKSDSE